MAEVWLAQRADGLLGRPVAVKLPRCGFSDSQFCQRLAREREILDCLSHPNIARLLDAGTALDGKPFLVLEFVDGEPIVDYCRRHGLSIQQRLELFLQVARAISFAHHSLVLHRDLKPSNILVTAEGKAYVLDFGIAKLLDHGRTEDSDLTMSAGRALTLPYASPEQIAGLPLTVGSDVYSLGVVLYELLTGSRPYQLATHAVCHTAEMPGPPPPSAVNPDRQGRRTLQGDLDNVILKALKGSLEKRYQSVDAFQDDIRRYLERRPVLARPDSRWYRARMCARRHRAAFLTVGGLLSVLLIAAILIVWAGASGADPKAQCRGGQGDRHLHALRCPFLLGRRQASSPPSMCSNMLSESSLALPAADLRNAGAGAEYSGHESTEPAGHNRRRGDD